MNKKALKTLEYNKIIELLVDCADSQMGKNRCQALLPSTDLEEIRKNQKETSDALSYLLQKGSISFSGLKDITPSLMRLDVGSTLSITELLNVSSLLNVALRVKAYSRKENTEEGEEIVADSLSNRFSYLEPLTNLNNEIKR